MKEEQKKVCDLNKMIDIRTFKIHPAHTILKKILVELPYPQFVYHNTFFKFSTVRGDRLAETRVKPEHNFFFGTLVPQGGVKPCADRIVENHAAMSLYTLQFKGENPNIADNGVYKELGNFFSEKKEANKCRRMFLSFLGSK